MREEKTNYRHLKKMMEDKYGYDLYHYNKQSQKEWREEMEWTTYEEQQAHRLFGCHWMSLLSYVTR